MDASPERSPDTRESTPRVPPPGSAALNPEPWHPPRLSPLLAYVLVPLLTGFLAISRALYGDGVYPIDNGDEPAETFLQVPMAQHCLASGDILKINVFNNFGTPILGDPVAYPYALHAWTYALFRPVIAMMINKFALSTLTMLVLTLFFRRYFGPLTSSFCAFLAFSSPAFFYFINNHPHQGALLYFTLVLLALRWFLSVPSSSSPALHSFSEGGSSPALHSPARRDEGGSSKSSASLTPSLTHLLPFHSTLYAPRSTVRAFCLYASFLLFFLSVGINGALFGLCFVAAYALFVTFCRRPATASPRPSTPASHWSLVTDYWSLITGHRSLLWVLALFLAALIAVHPHFLEFFRLAGQSARKDFDYQHWLKIPNWQLLKGLFIWAGDDQRIFAAMYYSIPVAALVLLGIGFSQGWGRPRPHTCLQPQAKSGDEPSLPLTKSSERTLLMFLLGLLPFLGVLFCRLFPDVAAMFPLIRSLNITRILWFSDVFLMLAAGVAIQTISRLLFARLVGGPGMIRLTLKFAFVAFIALTVFVRADVLHKLTNWFLTPEPLTGFQPPELLDEMKPYARCAAFLDPVPWGHEAKAAAHNVLGSSARAITSNKAFCDHLSVRSLIQNGYGGMTWFFRPSPPELLAPFGIRYFIAPTLDEQMKQWGWKLVDIKTAPLPIDLRLVLYESPQEATPFFLEWKKPQFLQNYEISGNELKVTIPPFHTTYGCSAIATFLYYRGWKAFLNSEPVMVRETRGHFISVAVRASDREQTLLLKYEPYTNLYLIGCFIISVVAGGLLSWEAGRTIRQ